MGRKKLFKKVFPGLAKSPFEITSPPNTGNNCIAWAAGDEGRWWEPDIIKKCYWPANVPREYTLEAYVRAFQSIGYTLCDDGEFESGWVKVAIFMGPVRPTHAAQQLDARKWKSKCGTEEDIEHELNALEGSSYGKVACFLKRRSE
jgi:hypothetical protein